MTKKLGVGVTVARSAEVLVKESDLVVTTTPAKAPVVKAGWLHPGLHITAMGADLADKQELEAECLARAGRVVVDRRAQCERMGELHHALKKGLKVEAVELGEVCLGRVPGRANDGEITICDLTGTGVQDTAIAALAFQRAKSAGTTIKN